ncbi:hypothetical protein D3C71_1644700 [compost metagenome]
MPPARVRRGMVTELFALLPQMVIFLLRPEESALLAESKLGPRSWLVLKLGVPEIQLVILLLKWMCLSVGKVFGKLNLFLHWVLEIIILMFRIYWQMLPGLNQIPIIA